MGFWAEFPRYPTAQLTPLSLYSSVAPSLATKSTIQSISLDITPPQEPCFGIFLRLMKSLETENEFKSFACPSLKHHSINSHIRSKIFAYIQIPSIRKESSEFPPLTIVDSSSSFIGITAGHLEQCLLQLLNPLLLSVIAAKMSPPQKVTQNQASITPG